MKINKNIFRLEHILESIEKIEYIATDLSYEEYLQDWIKQDAIIRNFEIIGEAIANLDDEIKDSNPDVEWKLAKDMRNFLVHEYFKIDFKAVWDTIIIHLPNMKIQILKTLEITKNID